jgi:UDP-GlcNAc:undecaprenyl-phosphate GlcNAc-1-phosphate transferase
MLGIVLGLLLIGFALSAPSTGLLSRLGLRVGALDTPGAKGHLKELRKVPNIGGIAIFWSTVAPLAAALAALAVFPDEVVAWAPAVEPYLGRARETQGDWAVILVGAFALHVMGLYDDRRALSAWPKLFLQLAVAFGTTIFSDVRLLHTLLAPYPGGEIASILITVAWIVVIVNAVNFIDNMDGLAAGIGAVAALCFMVATILNGQWFIASALALLAGSLGGFLVWNIPPARIFMGDGGSLFVGYILACLAARTTFVDAAHPDFALGTAWYGVFMPLLVLAVPLYDGVYVTVWRLRRGKSPFVGGNEHISHRLVQLGLSKRRAVVVLWLLTAVTAMSGIGLGLMRPWQAALVGAQLLGIFLVMLILETSVARVEDQPSKPAATPPATEDGERRA